MKFSNYSASEKSIIERKTVMSSREGIRYARGLGGGVAGSALVSVKR